MKGKTWLNNGKVYVKDELGVIPTWQIDETVTEKIQVTKNGKNVTENLFDVAEKDSILIEVKNETVLPRCVVKTDEQQLKAFIEIQPGYEITRKAKNTFPSRRAVLTVEEEKKIKDKVTIEDIQQALRDAGILFGIKEEVVIVAAQAEEEKLYEVAIGISPKDGQNGFLEMKVVSEVKNQLKKDKKGNIDFRESREIPIVEPGKVLGVIHPPIPGDIGRSVTNKQIQPKPVIPIAFYSDKGNALNKDQIVATRSGRPYIYQAGHIVKAAVIPKFTQKGNVNLATGNLRFFGDVEIQGEIEENMIVDAGNNLSIYSSINASTVTAGNSIFSGGNVANSILSVGEKNTLIIQLGDYLSKIIGQLEEGYEMLIQITQSIAYKTSEPKQSLQSIFNFIFRHRFTAFIGTVKDYIYLVQQEKDYLAQEWQEAAAQLNYLLFTVTQVDLTLTQIHSLLTLLQDVQEMSLMDFEESRIINIVSAANSTLFCNGDIQISGRGCLNSTIQAQGKIVVEGYLRGGRVSSKEDIEVHTVGSNGGVKTVLSVPSTNKIHIEKAYEGTELHVGHQQITLTETRMNVVAHLNEEKELVLQ